MRRLIKAIENKRGRPFYYAVDEGTDLSPVIIFGALASLIALALTALPLDSPLAGGFSLTSVCAILYARIIFRHI